MNINYQHILHYLIMFGILLLGPALLAFFPTQKAQLFSLVFVSVFYFLYGILHHYFEHTLTIKIVVEYVSISLLVISLYVFVYGGM